VSTYFIWELPVGPDQRWANSGWISHVVGGWRLGGIGMFASGRPLVLGGVTASNGVLVESTGNGTTQYHHWHERHPISTYLVSVASFPYSVYSDWYRPTSTDSMEIRFHLFPESVSPTAAVHAKVKVMNNYDDFSTLKEFVVIDICKRENIINQNVADMLFEKLKKRNAAAHPSTVHIGQLQAENFIDELVKNVILALPV